MKGPWKRFGNYVGSGKTSHMVGRVRDTAKPVHSGNIEWADAAFTNASDAERYAASLNASEK